MKRIFITMLVTGSLFTATTAFSQTEKSEIKNEKEIVIKMEGDSDIKTTIEIEGDDVKVNGEPLSEYDGGLKITRRKAMIADNPLTRPGVIQNLRINKNKTFLGVLTEKADKGTKIISVTDESSAEKAGLMAGDVITKFGNKLISNPNDLAEIVKTYQPGDEVTILILREGKKKELKAELGKTNTMAKAYSFSFDRPKRGFGNQLGGNGFLEFPDLYHKLLDDNKFHNNDQPKIGLEIQDTEEGNGVKILDVVVRSAAAKAGLEKGDIIIQLNGEKIENVNDVSDEINDAEKVEKYNLKIKRNNKEMNFEVNLPKKLEHLKF